jgi:RNA polymerase sigma factor (sigma-70 family)
MTPTARPIDELVCEAQAGSKPALQEVVVGIQDQVYGLALRMLWHSEDARDATQEILVRVVTGFANFRGDSKFATWVYRVASNYLISFRQSRAELNAYTFQSFGEELTKNLADEPAYCKGDPEREVLLQELRIGCTTGMLLCLDRPHRLAYILGEILEIEGKEAAEILEIPAANYRQRLVRARRAIVAFMKARCGLVNPANACRCHRRLAFALGKRRVDPENPLFTRDPVQARRFPEIISLVRSLQEAQRAAEVYRAQAKPIAPRSLAAEIRRVIEGLGV